MEIILVLVIVFIIIKIIGIKHYPTYYYFFDEEIREWMRKRDNPTYIEILKKWCQK